MRNRGWIYSLVALFLALWFWTAKEAPVCFCWPSKVGATFLGVAGYALFSMTLFLSSRWKGLERLFGGLDQIYLFHRKLGIWAFCLILAHPWVEALKWLPNQVDKFLWFTLPIHGRLSVNMGSYAYWLMVVILGITLLKLLSYDKWKLLHKFMSLVFVLASLHIVLSNKRVGTEFSQALLYLPMALGFWAILYKQLYLSFFAKRVELEVAEVKYLNDYVVELILVSGERPFSINPGQYGFFTFRGPSISGESHPFTLIGSAEGEPFSLLVKRRGDYTENLYREAKVGCKVEFEGPFGELDYHKGGSSQLWIAGGIGVVLFLAFLRTMKSERKIDFFYCVHSLDEAVYLEEFQKFSREHEGFRVSLHCTQKGSRLTFEEVLKKCQPLQERSVFMCGPLKLTNYFSKELQKVGVAKDSIFYENFEFL